MLYPRFSLSSNFRCAGPIAILIAGLVLASNAFAADPPAVPRITAKEIQSLVAKNKGRVVLLHFWATWCPPCADEFPALAKLYAAYKAKGVEVIGVSLNDFSEMQDVASFVRQQNPPFPLYIAGTVEESFYQSIDKRWSSGLPLSMIYDKTGKLRYFDNGERTYAQFEQDIRSLLQ
jgi:thiol-disulfide isomerase/thioredoxin